MRNTKPMLHKNFKGAKHKPDYIRKYDETASKPCKFCGADPKDIVIYDMPIKGGKMVKVRRCTKCDNLLIVGKVKARTEEE